MMLPESRTMTAHAHRGVGFYTFPAFDALGFVDNAFLQGWEVSARGSSPQ